MVYPWCSAVLLSYNVGNRKGLKLSSAFVTQIQYCRLSKSEGAVVEVLYAYRTKRLCLAQGAGNAGTGGEWRAEHCREVEKRRRQCWLTRWTSVTLIQQSDSCQTIWAYQSTEERFGKDDEIQDAGEECPHRHERQLVRKHVWNCNR